MYLAYCICVYVKLARYYTYLFIGCKADVVFMVDTSGSIQFESSNGFQLIIEFIQHMVQLFPIGLQDSLVGVISFSDDATLHFNVQSHTDITTLLAAIGNLPYDGRGTNKAAAMRLLLNSAQNGTMGLRPGHPHIAILITDGVSTVNEVQTIPIAQEIHASGIFQSLLVVGITSQVDFNELNAIAGNPSHVFYSATFDDLVQLPEALSSKICGSELIYDTILPLLLL